MYVYEHIQDQRVSIAHMFRKGQPSALGSCIEGLGEGLMHAALPLFCREAIYKVQTQGLQVTMEQHGVMGSNHGNRVRLHASDSPQTSCIEFFFLHLFYAC